MCSSLCFFLFLLFYVISGLAGSLLCSTGAFSSSREQGPPFVVARGLLFAVASLIAEHRLWVHAFQ